MNTSWTPLTHNGDFAGVSLDPRMRAPGYVVALQRGDHCAGLEPHVVPDANRRDDAAARTGADRMHGGTGRSSGTPTVDS